MGTHGSRIAGLALAASIALAPAVAAGAPADRGTIAYTDFDTITLTNEAGVGPVPFVAGAEPAWSPDGRLIAWFTGAPTGPHTGIVVANPDGSGRRAVLVAVGDTVVTLSGRKPIDLVTRFDLNGVTDRERLSGLAWSPDGGEVRLAVRERASIRLIGVDVTTGELTPQGGFRIPRGGIPRDVAWSPAGRLVAFSAPVPTPRRCGARERRIFTYRLRSAVVRRVPLRGHRCARGQLALRHPAFSPDGTRLAMTRIRSGTGGGVARTDLQTVDIGPRGRTVGPIRPAAPGLDGASWPTFSPDGQSIAYLFLRGPVNDQVGGVGVMRADGTGRRELVRASSLLLQHLDWGYAPRP